MYCYRFPDRATFLGLCDTLGWLEATEESPEATLIAYTSNRAIDEVGAVETIPGVYDEDGVELTPPAYDTSHHVNFQGEAPESWDEYLVVVNSPSRIFAGFSGSVPSDEILQEII